MPATRSSSGKPVQTLLAFQNQQNRAGQSSRPEPDVIVILSSEDEMPDRPSQTPVPKKHTKRRREKSKATVSKTFEIFDISSEEDPVSQEVRTAAALQSKIHELERDTSYWKEESLRIAAQLSKSKLEIDDLKSKATEMSASAQKANNSLDASILEDHVTCQVCTGRLWNPFILAECGHTFCQSCLQGWFGATLTQHRKVYPQYDTNQPIVPLLRETLQRLDPGLEAAFLQRLATMQPPRPLYTCPTCRKEVRTAPVENFDLKAIVRTVAKVSGEQSPKKAGPVDPIRRGPWGSFFPLSVAP